MNFLITDCIVKNDCLHVIKPNRDRILLDNEDLVYDYFRLTLRKDIRHVLDLFTEDAIIHEPFSKPEDSGLKVNTIIMITTRLYDLLHRPYSYEKSRIEWIDCYHNKNHVTCTFRSEQEIMIQFIFKFCYDSKDKSYSNNRRINFLCIQLIQ
jgi:hypothetical protein